MGDMSTQSKSHLGDGGCGSVQVGVGQGCEGLGSRVTVWDDDLIVFIPNNRPSIPWWDESLAANRKWPSGYKKGPRTL